LSSKQPATIEAVPARLPMSDLIGVVFGRKQQDRQDNKEQNRGVDLQFRIVQCGGELTADAIDFVQHGDGTAHDPVKPIKNC
jgi:hypothetical protein